MRSRARNRRETPEGARRHSRCRRRERPVAARCETRIAFAEVAGRGGIVSFMLRAPRVTHPAGPAFECRRAWSRSGSCCCLGGRQARATPGFRRAVKGQGSIFTVATGVRSSIRRTTAPGEQSVRPGDDRCAESTQLEGPWASDRLFSFDLYPKAPYKKTIGPLHLALQLRAARKFCQAYYQPDRNTAAAGLSTSIRPRRSSSPAAQKHWLAARRTTVSSTEQGRHSAGLTFRLLR